LVTPLGLLLALAACTSGNVVIRLIPADTVATPPGGAVRVYQAQSDVAPDTDEADRTLGSLGFTGSLGATLSPGVHSIFAVGEFASHPGCEEPEIPQSTCTPSGWEGHTLAEVFGPDWGPDDAETDVDVVEIAEGEVGEVVITVTPGCECTD
jgi:hypothetical protein